MAVLDRYGRHGVGFCVALGLLGFLPACAGESTDLVLPPERVVLVLVDTLRRDHVGVYGGDVPTPNIDSLAASGQVFSRARASFHQTTMSIASLFTGRTPSVERGETRGRLEWTGRTWCGLLRDAQPDDEDCIPAGVPTLAERMRDAGYWTAAVITNKLLHEPGGYERGFDAWKELPHFAPTAVSANRRVRRILRTRPHDRFFLYVHYMDVHSYAYRGESYAAGVRKADWALGDLMEALDEEGVRDGTLVVFTSDHGERLGEEHFAEGTSGHNGNPSFETLLRVPLVVSPALFEDPDAPVRSDDLHRMILEVAGAEPGPPPELDDDELFVSEVTYQTHRSGRWKLFRHRESGETHLVDLAEDPDESEDVADAHPEVRDELESRVDELAAALGVADAPSLTLSDDDKARLEALGYIVPRRVDAFGRPID